MLAAHISDVMKQPDRTMEGIFVKAEALAAWGRVNDFDQHWALFDPQIATALLHYSKGDAT